LTILQASSYSIGQKSGEICTGQVNLQPISFKTDRLLDVFPAEIGDRQLWGYEITRSTG